MGIIVDVLVIGTEPPCPRCDLLTRQVAEAASAVGQVNLRHWAFDSEEAEAFGRNKNFKVGTAKDVSEAGGIPVNWDAAHKAIDDKKSRTPDATRAADLWTPELDKLLEPCQKAAEFAGYYMTPVLVINGRVIHHGSVPSIEQIGQWLAAG